MKLQKVAGATSEIWQIFIADSSSATGAGLTGLVFNSGSLTAYYHRDTDTTATAIALVTMTVGSFTSSGFKEIDSTNMPGWYQLCPPNAALASGAKSVALLLKGATNMAPLPIEVQLSAVNPDSATAFVTSVATVTTVTNQLTAAAIATGVWQDATGGDFTTASSIGKALYISNIAPGASGGHAIGKDANGGVNVGQWLATTVATPATAGIPDVNVKNMNNVAATAITTIKAVQGLTTADQVTTVSGNVSGNVTGSVGSVTGAVGSVTGSVGSIATGGITKASLAAATGLVPLLTGTASAGGATSITLAGGVATNSYYNNCLVVLTGGTGAGQSRFITAYVGGTTVATVAAWATAPDATTTFAVEPFDAVAGASAPTAAQVATAVWQDATSTDFTASSSIGKSLYTTGNAPGAASGLALVGSNVGTATSVTGAVGSVTGNVGGNVSGNVVGSVASVTGAVASVTAAVTVTGDLSATMKASVTTAASAATPVATLSGDLTSTMKISVTTACTASTPTAAAVTGAVGSVTAPVTVGTNSDKTGYRLDATGSATLTEGYAPKGAGATLAQLLYSLLQALTEFSTSGTTITIKKRDQSTTAFTETVDSATAPTVITQAS